MFADLTDVYEGKLLEMLEQVFVRRPFTERYRIEYERINQELERREQATERQHGIDMVPESDDE